MRRRSRWYGARRAGERVEEFEQRRRARIEADPDEAAPAFGLDRLQPGAGRDRIELLLVYDLDQRAVEVIAPGVIAAANAGVGEGAGSVGQSGAPMQAGVVEGLDGVDIRADDQDRLIADEVFEESLRPRRPPPPGTPPARRGTTRGRTPTRRTPRWCSGHAESCCPRRSRACPDCCRSSDIHAIPGESSPDAPW